MAAMGMAAAVAAGGAIGIIAYQTSCGCYPGSRPVAVPVKKSLAGKNYMLFPCCLSCVFVDSHVLFVDVVSVCVCLPKKKVEQRPNPSYLLYILDYTTQFQMD